MSRLSEMKACPPASIDGVSAPDTQHLRRAMGRFATGVTVVTTCGPDGKLEGVTANSFSTVSLDPPLVLWSLSRRAGSFDTFQTAKHFVVNVLSADQIDLCRHFATRSEDKLSGVAFRDGLGGCPVLPDVLAHFECVREAVIEGGDHCIFIGRVVEASHRDGEPLVFSAGGFHRPTPIDGV